MFYRATRRAKRELTLYYRKLFRLVATGRLQVTDGDELIRFTGEPKAMERFAWDAKELPVVLVGPVSGSFVSLDLRNFGANIPRSDGSGVDPVEIGQVNMNVTVSAIADTNIEAENLIDFVCLYMSNTVGRAYLARRGLMYVTTPPRFSDTVAMQEDINDPTRNRYETSMTVNIVSTWNDVGEFLPYPTAGFDQRWELVQTLEQTSA